MIYQFTIDVTVLMFYNVQTTNFVIKKISIVYSK